jgi:hypothetical protein
LTDWNPRNRGNQKENKNKIEIINKILNWILLR